VYVSCPSAASAGAWKISEKDSPMSLGNCFAETSLTESFDDSARWIRNVLPTSGTYVARRRCLGFTASATANAKDTLSQQQLIQQGFTDKDKAVRGVNIDEEMANTILFQNTYSANARVISVTKELFKTLLDAFS